MSSLAHIDLPNDETARHSRPKSASLTLWWRHLSLAAQFAIAAAVVIGITMAALGTWVVSRIETSVIRHTALAAALYMDRFVEPHVQELATGNTLSEESRSALHDLMTNARIGKQMVAIKIWDADGTIAYSSEPELIGQRFPISDKLALALSGTVAAEFDELDAEENVLERRLRRHILEIYAPIRQTGTEQIIGVAEFYQISDQLANELMWARGESIFAVACLSLIMLAALSGIVGRGSRTIASQQSALSERVAELCRLLDQNDELRQRVADANRRSSESSERFLRRYSAELHDGPVQLIGLALLRLSALFPGAEAGKPDTDAEIIQSALKDALREIRDLSHGLALPELENMTCAGAMDLAVANHERRSGTTVETFYAEDVPADIPASVKTCAYRFVQEGLNNAFRHAAGIGQQVALLWDGCCLTFEVKDAGPGIAGRTPADPKSGLGLPGLKDRIESLGGTMQIISTPGAGTCLRARFPLVEPELQVGGCE